jgi:hypothetical protein
MSEKKQSKKTIIKNNENEIKRITNKIEMEYECRREQSNRYKTNEIKKRNNKSKQTII